jgi:hypothetical protein
MNIINNLNSHDINEILTFNKKNYDTKILFATGFAGFNHAICFDTLLALSLIKWNIQSEFLICDKALKACTLTKFQQTKPHILQDFRNNQIRCETCFQDNKYDFLEKLGFKINIFTKFLDENDLEKINLEMRNLDIKKNHINNLSIDLHEHALSNTLRYFAKGNLTGEKFESEIYKRFYYSCLITYFAFKKIIKKNKYSNIIMSHGIYCPHGIINDLCKLNNIQTYIYIPSYRKKTFIISKNDTYHKTMVSSDKKYFSNPLNNKQKKVLKKYINGRMTGKYDWIWFNKENNLSTSNIINKNNINTNNNIFLLLTNVVWDARLHYTNNCFDNILEWIFTTIDFFIKNQNKTVIVRVHPAEITGSIKSRQKVFDEIMNKYKKLPSNIIIIKPESPDSTYKLMELSDCVLVHSTKASIEAAYFGKRVIVAGEAWIKNKGFTLDPINKSEYLEFLGGEIKKLNKIEVELAKSFAYYFFFKKMIKIPEINITTKNSFYLDFKKNPFTKTSRNLKLIIDQIVNNEECVVENFELDDFKENILMRIVKLKNFITNQFRWRFTI